MCQDQFLLKHFGRKGIPKKVLDAFHARYKNKLSYCDFCIKEFYRQKTRPNDQEYFRIIERQIIQALIETRKF